MRIRCAVDRCDTDAVEGWILDMDDPTTRLSVAVFIDGRSVGVAEANIYRADLEKAAIGDGFCAFRFSLAALKSSGAVTLMLHGSDLLLPIDVGKNVRLWCDRPDWMMLLREKYRTSRLDSDMADDVARFVRDGFVALPVTGAQNTHLLWREPPPGLQARSFEPAGYEHLITPTVDLMARRAALVDPHRFGVYPPAEAARFTALLADGAMAVRSSRHIGLNWDDDPAAIRRDGVAILTAESATSRIHLATDNRAVVLSANQALILHPGTRYMVTSGSDSPLTEWIVT